MEDPATFPDGKRGRVHYLNDLGSENKCPKSMKKPHCPLKKYYLQGDASSAFFKIPGRSLEIWNPLMLPLLQKFNTGFSAFACLSPGRAKRVGFFRLTNTLIC